MLTEESISYAIDRVEAFSKVNKTRSLDEKLEAVDVLLDSLGLNTDLRVVLHDRLGDFTENEGEGSVGAILVGVLIGLYVNDYQNYA